MNKNADFYCYGIIGEADPLFVLFTGTPDPVISSQKVSDFLKDLDPGVETITVHINSRGGSVDEGFAIHDLFINSGREITTLVEGQCASIATVVMLAGSSRKMTENSTVMIHNPWIDPSIISGLTADDLQKITNDIRAYETRILDFYVNKTGGDRAQLSDLMKAESVLTSDQALELKFATEIKTPVKAYAYFNFKNQTQDKNQNTIMEKLEQTLNVFATKMQNMLKGKGFTVLALDAKTADGQSLTISDDDASGAPSVGDSVTDSDGKAFVTPETELEDGTKITTDDGGIITEVKAPAAAAASDTPPATPDARDEQIRVLTEANAALQTTVDSFTAIQARMEAKITALGKSIVSVGEIETGAQNFGRQPGANVLTKDEVKAKIKDRNKK